MTIRRRHALLPTLVAAAVAASAACGSDESGSDGSDSTGIHDTAPPTEPTSRGSGLFGVVLAGPTCPVETADEPCPPRPVDAEVNAQDAGGVTIASTRTDADGRYHLSLAPGAYTLVAETDETMSICQPVTVTVPSGAPVQADIGCDTGIR
jgi:Carboxypeptidase regulatory-like domain